MTYRVIVQSAEGRRHDTNVRASGKSRAIRVATAEAARCYPHCGGWRPIRVDS